MAGHSEIDQVNFGISSDEERMRESCAPITSYELFNAAGAPVEGGVYDLRLGTTDHAFTCITCAHNKKLCPGHRGHLVLRAGVPLAIGLSDIRHWLRVVCHTCARLLADREKLKSLPPARRLAVASTSATEGRHCVCGTVHPRVVTDDDDYFTFWAEPAGATRARGAERKGTKLYHDTIRAILGRIPASTVEFMGRAQGCPPSRLIQRVVTIPPNTIRPGVKSFGGVGSSYHDTTNLLQHLVKRNSQLPERLPDAMGPLGGKGPIDPEIERSMQNMEQIYYDMVHGGSATSATQGNRGKRGLVAGGRPVRSVLRNLPRKEGHLRSTLLGMRVVFIARSTISGNSRFRVDEAGMPLKIARTLQVEEVVQEYNRAWLMPFYLNGRRQYPGSTLIERKSTGEIHDVAGQRDAPLEVGDVLLRDVIDGDYVYFGRQPTLERSSMGVHRVRVILDPAILTLQMNVLACAFYNADFDGDTMNMFAVRGIAARAEAPIMSGVSNWFISTKSGGPVVGQVQDSTIGCAELTRSSVRMDRFHAMGMLASTGIEPPRFDKHDADRVYTGRDIASFLLNDCPINYRREPSSYSEVYAPYIAYKPDEVMTVIERGRLVSGVLDKRAIGAGATGGIYHLIGREYGAQKALDVIYAMQQTALQFLMCSGITVGTGDLLPTQEALSRMRELVAGVRLESATITSRLLRGEIMPPIDSTVHDHYERLQISALKVSEGEILRWVLGSINPDTNGFLRMIITGAKGSNPNLIHVMGIIGQTTINGERIAENFSYRRTLPYFPRFSTDASAYGFVGNSYITGMNVGEYVHQNMNSRFDLINKALSTSVTGTFMRKGVMNTQSCIVDNHRRVMAGFIVVQFLYGEDGLDARELEKVTLRTVVMSNEALKSALGIVVADMKMAGEPAELAETQSAVDEALRVARDDRDMYRRTFCRIEAANFGQTFSADVQLPVNVARIVQGVRAAAQQAGHSPPPLVAAGLLGRIRRVAALCERLPYVMLNEDCEKRRAPVPLHFSAATSLMVMQIRIELCPKALLTLSDEQLTFVADSILLMYDNSLISYGTAVGVLAAQSIAEPLTQYMLDSHHRSVAGGTNKSGLTRVSEIYGARPVEDEQSSAMQLLICPSVLGAPGDALTTAKTIATSMEYVVLKQFVSSYDTLLEPFGQLLYPPHKGDQEWITEYERNHPLSSRPSDLTNWCYRFAIDRMAITLKDATLEHIVLKLRAAHPQFLIVHTTEVVPSIAIRMWARAPAVKRGARVSTVDTILETPIRGIPGIIRASAKTIVRRKSDEKTGALLEEERIIVETVGTNLYQALLNTAVDPECAISNSVGDTYKMFGIEAARDKIISETKAVMEDKTPSLRHLMTFADNMTRTGRPTSIERGGTAVREHNNVLLRMAYGDPIRTVAGAALTGARSPVYGIAAPRLLGAMPRIGTLYNSVSMDEDFVRQNSRSVDSVLDDM